jgi:hypothetical protein
MAQWGNTDDAANSVLWAASQLNKTANTDNQTALFGNTTPDGFISGRTDGQFGLDVTEIGVTNASVVAIELITPGSGYSANATVTVAGNATANALAGATGRISAINVVLPGNTYTTSPAVTVAAPTAITFNALTAVSNTNDTIAITTANSKFLVNDRVQYLVAAGNTAIGGLSNNTFYFIQAANTTTVTLATAPGGAAINLTASVSETGHSLTGETATAVATISGVGRGAAHAGWVLRTVGEGGRAGRVQYETLVAMGSLTGDAEDTILKDA